MPQWPSIPQIVATDPLRIQRHAGWTQDDSGGRMTSYSSPEPALDGFISAATSSERELHSRDSMVVKYVAVFTTNPNLKLRDRVLWDEFSKTLTVVSVEIKGDATNRQFHVYLEDHPVQ